MAANIRESQDMLARVSRSESETHNAYRKIEDHLRSLARRLDSNERAQSDNSRAMSEAAQEISLASHEQMQAFDTLGAHVISLGERLDRIEEKTNADATGEVVRGLQDGLARMADQVAGTARQSASQISVLASAMEAVVTKMSEAHKEAAGTATFLTQRVGHLDERMHALETTLRVKSDATDRALQRLDERCGKDAEFSERLLAGVEERHTAIREELMQNLHALDTRYGARRQELQRSIDEARTSHDDMRNEVHARLAQLENHFAAAGDGEAERKAALEKVQQAIEETRSSQQDMLNEVQARVGALESRLASDMDEAENDRSVHLQHLEDSIATLTSRVAAQETQSAALLTRLDEGSAHMESTSDDDGLKHRVYGVERSIQELMDRLEAAERQASAAYAHIEQHLQGLSATRDDIGHGTSSEAIVETAEADEPDAAAVEMPAEDEALDAPDMPPFDEPIAAAFKDNAVHRAFGQRNPDAFDPPQTDHDDIFREERPLAAEGFAAAPVDEDFLTAARRSAATATAALPEEPSATTLGGFTWGAHREEPQQREDKPRSRLMLTGAIALVAILAIGLGVMLSQRLGSHALLQATPVEQVGPVLTKPAIVKPSTAPVQKAPAAKTAVPAQSEKAATAKHTAGTAGGRLDALANGGNSKAQLLLGLKYLDGDGVTVNEADAAKWLQRAADQGEPVAQYRLGTLYERGHGVAKDAATALRWYQAAARQGNRKAMHNLAVSYAEGAGTARNYAEAARWFGRAATLGLADSQFNLAVLYERGLGVPQSLSEAYKWYAIAAAQGDNESKARVAALATQLSPAEHDAAQKAADTFRPQAINRAANVPPETPGR